MARRKRIRFGNHAFGERMPERGISVRDVLATLANPDYEFPGNEPGTCESYGTTADGRAFYVVTARNRTFVVTVVEVREPQ
jgi:hypothetical protein